MSKDNFNKQVRQKMDELRLLPSPEVWEEVEKRIRKEKERRRFILLFFLFGALLLGGTGWWIINGNKKQTPDNNFQTQSIVNKKTNGLPAGSSNETQLQEKPDNNVSKNGKTDSWKMISPAIIKIGVVPHTIKNNPPVVSKIKPDGKSTEVVIPLADLSKKEYPNNTKPALPSVEKDDQLADTETSDHMVMNDKSGQQLLEEPLVMNNDSLQTDKQDTQKPFVINKDLDGNSKKDSPDLVTEKLKDSSDIAVFENKLPGKNKAAKKWIFSVMLERGVSNIGEGIDIFDKNANADIPLTSSSPSVATLPLYYHTSRISSSTSYSFGAIASYPVSKTFDINVGLSYLNLANKVTVGNRVDSSFVFNNYAGYGLATNYYRGSIPGSFSYRSQYHFISFSEGFSWKFINSNKFHVSWDNDLSYNLLLSSNVLYFDRGLQGYYKFSKLLNHSYIFLSTGLSFPVSKKLEINPFASWGVTDVWRYAVDASQKNYFTNYGVKVKFLVNKK